jgi:hypothetical protein
MPTHLRRAAMERTKFFVCQCERCGAGAEPAARAFRCPRPDCAAAPAAAASAASATASAAASSEQGGAIADPADSGLTAFGRAQFSGSGRVSLPSSAEEQLRLAAAAPKGTIPRFPCQRCGRCIDKPTLQRWYKAEQVAQQLVDMQPGSDAAAAATAPASATVAIDPLQILQAGADAAAACTRVGMGQHWRLVDLLHPLHDLLKLDRQYLPAALVLDDALATMLSLYPRCSAQGLNFRERAADCYAVAAGLRPLLAFLPARFLQGKGQGQGQRPLVQIGELAEMRGYTERLRALGPGGGAGAAAACLAAAADSYAEALRCAAVVFGAGHRRAEAVEAKLKLVQQAQQAGQNPAHKAL